MYLLIAGVLLAIVALAYAVDRLIAVFDDPREPPRLHPTIPLIGHLLGMINHGMEYALDASKRVDSDVFTMGIFHFKIYVSRDVGLLPGIAKAKTLSFKPFIQTAARVMSGNSKEFVDTIGGEMSDHLSQTHRAGLAVGPELDASNLRMGRRVLKDVDDLARGEGEQKIALLDWVQRAVVQASASGMYGSKHPYLDPKIGKAFWVWQSYMPMHMASIDPTGKGYAARDVVLEALRQWERDVPSDAAWIIRDRHRVFREGGASEEDIARQDMAFGIALFANTTPTLFWTIYELFSRSDLLEGVRREVAANAILTTNTGESSGGAFVLDVAALKTKCPLLLAVYQETQRTRHVHANIRKITDDTLLGSADGSNKYLLKKGNFVQVPGQLAHMDTRFWGADAAVFDPDRFLLPVDKANKAGAGKKGPAPPSSFQAWGAPPHLCPARQFAATEVLMVVALLALRVDMAPAGGAWKRNPPVKSGELTTVLNPKNDVNLVVTARREWMGDWTVEMGESTTRVSLASG